MRLCARSYAAATFVFLCCVSATAFAGDSLAPTDWPQWRGPGRACRVPESPKWPDDLDGLEQSWRIEMAGPSYSGPIVAGDRVFVTETVDKKKEIVRALDRKTGKELWKVDWLGSMSVPFFAARNGSWIRSTPATDGESLFVAGIQDVLVCLDVKTGNERWRVDFKERYGTSNPDFGCVCSPMVRGDYVYMQAGGSFVKLNKKDGSSVWRTLNDGGGMYGSAFSSPVFDEIAGKPQVIVQTREKLAGVDDADGKVLWEQKVPAFRGMNILTPTVFKNGIFTSSHRNASYFYQVSESGNGFNVEETWSDKAKGYMSSPVVVGDYAYLHLGNGRISCFDLRSGEEQWRTKKFGDYMSMAVQGDKILGLDMRGGLVLFMANPKEFELLDKKKVSDEECWAHVAVSGNDIIIRELNAVSAWRWKANSE